MDFWSHLIEEVIADNTLYVVLGLLATYLIVRALAPQERPRLILTLYLAGIHVILVPVVAYLRSEQAPLYEEVRLATLILAAIASTGMLISLIFAVIMPRLHLHTPRILHDVVFGGASTVAVFALASHLGFNLSGLIATSAVLTGVIGFALQDTLGNIIGGLAMQLDNTIGVGDWIEFEGHTGRVAEMRWRYTALETRSWETILIPNASLMDGRVSILGRRTNMPRQWRREIEFHVDFFHAPTTVIQIVNEALQTSQIPNVAADPQPHALLKNLDESFGNYAVRYWLTDIACQDPVESDIRIRIYFALKRHRVRLAVPTGHVFLTDAPSRKEESARRHVNYKQQFIKEMELFSSLSDDECAALAEELRYAPFARGEHLTNQGQASYDLYILTRGSCQVLVRSGGDEKEVAVLEAPTFFGEMSLMTGAVRSTTIIAKTDLETYRLERDAFERFIQPRPEVAEQVARVLARRQMSLESALEDLDNAHAKDNLDARSWEFLKKIQSFFNLSPTRK